MPFQVETFAGLALALFFLLSELAGKASKTVEDATALAGKASTTLLVLLVEDATATGKLLKTCANSFPPIDI